MILYSEKLCFTNSAITFES